jgi:hypothetical protein
MTRWPGRVAVPLAQRGVPVTGIELSHPMTAQLRTKAGEAAIPVIAGDMASPIASSDPPDRRSGRGGVVSPIRQFAGSQPA